MSGPKTSAQRSDGIRGRKEARTSSTMKPEQFSQGERIRRPGRPVDLKVDVENLGEVCPLSPIEKHMVETPTASYRSRQSPSSFLQPDQFFSELRVKTPTGNQTDLSISDSPCSVRSTRSTRSGFESQNEAMSLDMYSPSLKKTPRSAATTGNGTDKEATPKSPRQTQMSDKDGYRPRGIEGSTKEPRTSRVENGIEHFYEPANSLPTLELSYEGKPAPAPAHLRVKAGTGTGSLSNNPSQPSPENLETDSSQTSSDNVKLIELEVSHGVVDLQGSKSPELQKSSSEGSARPFKAESAAMLKLQSTSVRIGGTWSPGRMKEKLGRSFSGRKDNSSRAETDSKTPHSFHGNTTMSAQSQPLKSHGTDLEGNAAKPVSRLRRMFNWLGRKTSSKSSSGLKGEKNGDSGKSVSKAEQRVETDAEKEPNERTPRFDPEIHHEDGPLCSPRSSASSVSTSFSDASSKSFSNKHSHNKKHAKSESGKTKPWLQRVQHKFQGRGTKDNDDDVYEAVRKATLHDGTGFKDGDGASLNGSARYNLEKNALSKLLTKHKRNSTWDAGKLSPTDHPFSPKQPRLHKSDAHVLLAPPKRLTGHVGVTEFQRRRGKPSTLNIESRLSATPTTDVADKLTSPRNLENETVEKASAPAAPEAKAIVLVESSHEGPSEQGLPLPGLPSTECSTSLDKAELQGSPTNVSPERGASNTPPISPAAQPSSRGSSFGSSFKGFNSPLPLPVRVGSRSSPSSPIYASSVGLSKSPERLALSPVGTQSTPTSPGLYTPSLGWTGMQSSPTSPGMSGASSTNGAGFQDSLMAILDVTSRRSPGQNSGEQLLLEDSKSLADSMAKGVQQDQSRADASKPKNGSKGAKGHESHSPSSTEKESYDKQKSGSGSAVPLLLSPRSQMVSFEQVVAGRGRTPPTDNTLMKFFFKCREIEHLNKFLALQKKRFLESINTETAKCFHMILSEAGKGLSSMVSTICTAWLLENTMASASVKWHPIPVMNISQDEMWQHRDVAWLFHVVGIEVNAILFLDEITSNNETLVAGRVKRAVTGQDILVTKNEASCCTIVSEKFRQEAPKLLQARYIKTLLLAGILVDTKNLSAGTSRDKQQATILLVGAGSLGRNGFYNHLKNIRDENYITPFIKEIYGDSSALTGDKPSRRGRGVETTRPTSVTLPSDKNREKPTPLVIPKPSSEITVPISPPAPAPAPASKKPITKSIRKSEPEVKRDMDSTKPPWSTKKESQGRSRRSEPEIKTDVDINYNTINTGPSRRSEISVSQGRGTAPNSKISHALRKLRPRSVAQ